LAVVEIAVTVVINTGLCSNLEIRKARLVSMPVNAGYLPRLVIKHFS